MGRLRYFFFYSESRWVVLLLSIALLFFLLFWWDYNKEANIGGRKIIGKIVYKNNIVERKFADEAVWYKLRSNSPLTNMDLIRSENLSDAVIYLKGNIKIRVEENTMFFLDLTGDTFRLEFRGGRIQIEQDKEPKKLLIQSGSTSIDLGDATLSIQAEPPQKDSPPKDLSVLVEKGAAKIRLAGKSKNLHAGQIAHIKKNAIQVRELDIVLDAPATQALLESGQKLAFRFHSKRGFVPKTLELAKDRNFQTGLRRYPAALAQNGIALSPGDYFWRVRAYNPKTKKSSLSESRRFRILERQSLQTLGPAKDAVFFAKGQPSAVGFAWTPSPLAQSYELEIAKNPRFAGKVHRYTTEASSYTVRGLPDGEYYWRVRAHSDLGLPEALSPTHRFRIEGSKQEPKKTKDTQEQTEQTIDQPSRKDGPATESKEQKPENKTKETESQPSTIESTTDKKTQRPNEKQTKVGQNARNIEKQRQNPEAKKQKARRDEKAILPRITSSGLQKVGKAYVFRLQGEGLSKDSQFHFVKPGHKVRVPRSAVQKKGTMLYLRLPASSFTPGPYDLLVKNPGQAERRYPRFANIPKEKERQGPASSKKQADKTSLKQNKPEQNKINQEQPRQNKPGQNRSKQSKSNKAAAKQKESYKEKNKIKTTQDANASASLAKYTRFVRSLKRSCPATPLPDIVIRECFSDHVTLNLSDRYRRNIYFFISLKSQNIRDRLSAYNHFSDNCSPAFRPAIELMQARLIRAPKNLLPQEQAALKKALFRQKNCR